MQKMDLLKIYKCLRKKMFVDLNTLYISQGFPQQHKLHYGNSIVQNVIKKIPHLDDGSFRLVSTGISYRLLSCSTYGRIPDFTSKKPDLNQIAVGTILTIMQYFMF